MTARGDWGHGKPLFWQGSTGSYIQSGLRGEAACEDGPIAGGT